MPFLVLLIIALTGSVFFQFFRRAQAIRPKNLFSHFPVYWGLGTGIIYWAFLWTCWWRPFEFYWVVPWLLLLGGVQIIAIFMGRESVQEETGPTLYPRTKTDTVLLLVLAATLIAAMAILFSLPLLDWDARILWALKAKILAAEKTLVSETFRDPYRLHIHPRYPLLVPWITAFLAQFQGAFQEFQYQLMVCVFGLLSVQLFYELNRQANDRQTSLLSCLLLVYTGCWTQGFLQSRVELVLAFYLLLTVRQLLRWLEHRSLADLFLAGIFLFCSASIKNEGLLLAGCCCLGLGMTLLCQNEKRSAFFAVTFLSAIFLLLNAIWFRHLSFIPSVSDENYLHRLHFSGMTEGIQRADEILRGVMACAGDMQQWHLVWIAVPVLFFTVFKIRLHSERFRLLFFLLFSYLAGILIIYLISPWQSIQLHIQVTFHRIMLPMLPVIILLFQEMVSGKPSKSA